MEIDWPTTHSTEFSQSLFMLMMLHDKAYLMQILMLIFSFKKKVTSIF